MFQTGKPIFADYFLETLYGLTQGLQTFLSDCHYTTVRGPDILRIKIVSGYATFYEVNKFLKMHYFSFLTKSLREPDELSWRAGFGPRSVVWRP